MNDQEAFETADRTRAELADLIDLQMAPLGLAALDALSPTKGDHALDVGCGAGATLVALAKRVGPRGKVIGVDIGPHVTRLARQRTRHLPNVQVLQGDASRLTLATESLDHIYSRFGVMFFADPVSAFSNLRRMLKRRGRIGLVCWRSLAENELDVFALHAAGLPLDSDTAPFSFAEPSALRQILSSAGFARIAIEPFDCAVSAGGVEDTLRVLTRVGALGARARRDDAILPAALPQLRTALEARTTGGRVSLNAATWIVVATAA